MTESKIKTMEIELKKHIILEEATKLIDKVGFKNAKMEDIAQKVGFSKASLYSYFKDKEEIAMQITKQHLLKLYNKISDLPSKKVSAIEKLEIMRSVHMEFVKKSKNFIVIKADFSIMEKCHKDVVDIKLKTFDILKSILEQGKKEKVFNNNINVDSTVLMLESMMTGIVFLNSLIKNAESEIVPNFDVEEMISFAMDFFYLGITNTNAEINKCS